jgi:GH35 family endo-1,4-beta-xylanase
MIDSQTETCGIDNAGYCINFKEKCKSGYEGIGHSNCKSGRSAECCVPAETATTPTTPPISTPQSQEQISADSPFGILDPYETDADSEYIKDIGAKWLRKSTVINWDLVEKPDGSYDWSRADQLVEQATSDNVNILFGVMFVTKRDMAKCTSDGGPCDTEAYSDFLRAAVTRYKDTVKHWQFSNEENNLWKGTPRSYADFVKLNYQVLKEECSDCKLLLGGVSGDPQGYYDFYKPLLKKLNGQYFDIFDFHLFSEANTYKNYTFWKGNFDVKEYYNDIKEDLNNDDIDIWITEMATYSGKPNKMTFSEGGKSYDPPFQTEQEQASELIKRYVYPLSLGVEKIFWVKITEWAGFGRQGVNGYFDNTGLVNNPKVDGESHKKLSYYTYKKMVEVLEGSDWDNIEAIQESDDIYIYKFINKQTGKPTWVAWNNNEQSKTIILDVGNLKSIKITETVPNYESGLEVADYSTAFNTKTRTTSNSQVTINLGQNPVFIEEE